MLENLPVCTNGCMSSFTEFKILIVIHLFSISMCNILHTYLYKCCVTGYTMEKWVTIKIPTDLLIEVGKFLETKGKKLGYPSKTQFISEAIRESLNNTQKMDNNEKILQEIGIINRKFDEITESNQRMMSRIHLLALSAGEKQEITSGLKMEDLLKDVSPPEPRKINPKAVKKLIEQKKKLLEKTTG